MQTVRTTNNVITLPFGIKTINGLDAVLFFGEASEDYPLLGMYNTEGQWYPHRWTREGRAYENIIDGHPLDLQFTAPVNTETPSEPLEVA